MMDDPTPQAMKILRKMVREIEIANNIQFGDGAWQTIRKHVAEIETMWSGWLDEANGIGKVSSTGLWDAMSEQQRWWLRHTDNHHRTNYLSHEEDKARQARELEDLGLLAIEFDARHGRSYTIYATLEGKALANKKSAT